MDTHKYRSGKSAFILIIIICSLFTFVSTFGDDDKQEKKKPSISEMKMMRSTSSISRSYWDKLKTRMNKLQAYFFPPSLDFRGSDREEEAIKGTLGSGEKLKEAAVKSLEKGKETVEESAESAAEIAGETAKKTEEKVKKSFSDEL